MDDYDERVELKDREDALKKIPKVQSLAQVDMPYPRTRELEKSCLLSVCV